MNTGLILGFTAGTLQIVACWIYNRQLILGHSKPNAASWGLWAFLSALSTTTYIAFTGDIIKGIMPLMISGAVMFIFVYALAKGKYVPLGYWDKSILEIGIVSIMVWWFYQSALYANLVLQIGMAFSYVPTYLGIRRDAGAQRYPPWFLWAFAYVLGGTVVLLRWTGQFEALVYPFMNALLSAGVGFWAMYRAKING